MRKFFFSIARLIIIPPILYIINKLIYNQLYYSSFSNNTIRNIIELLFVMFIFLIGFIQFFLIIQLVIRSFLRIEKLEGLSDYVDSNPVLRYLNLYKHHTIHIVRTRIEPTKKKNIFPLYSFKVFFLGGLGLILEGDFLLGVIVLLLEIKTGFYLQVVLALFYNYEHLFYLLRTDYEPVEDMDIFLAQRLRLIPRQNNYESIKKSIYDQRKERVPLRKKWTAPRMTAMTQFQAFSNTRLSSPSSNIPKFNNRTETFYKRPNKPIFPNTKHYPNEPFSFFYDGVRYRCVVNDITFNSPRKMWEFNVQECLKLLRESQPIPINTTNAVLKKALLIFDSKGYEYLPPTGLVTSEIKRATYNIYHSAVIIRAIERKYDVSEWS